MRTAAITSIAPSPARRRGPSAVTLVVAVVVSALVNVGLKAAESVSISPVFGTDVGQPLAILLEGDTKTLIRDDKDVRDWHAFKLTAGDATFDVKLRVRGNFRRAQCQFPPIMLNLKKKQVRGSAFDGLDKVKLVTHCGEGRVFTANTMEEFLAYRLFNELTDQSFRVRLLEVTYRSEGEKDRIRAGFLIEPVDVLKKRLSGKHVAPRDTMPAALSPGHASLVAMFQYMIGNTDFSQIRAFGENACCHNTKLIQTAGELLSVAYDFDMSGLVSANYATLNEKLGLRNVRQRMYRGFCVPRENLEANLSRFAARRPKLASMIGASGLLRPGDIKRATRYLSDY